MPNIAEIYEAFGLEQPTAEPTSGNTQEVADPAEDTSENNQEVAAPDADVDTDETEELGVKPEEEPERKPMSKEERTANAKRRRQQEIDEAVNEAREQERAAVNARVEKFLAQAGIKNAYDGGKEIKTLEDGEKWAEADRLARVEKDLSKGKLTTDALRLAVEQSETVQKLQEQLSAVTAVAQESNDRQFRAGVEMELAEIAKLDPTIKSLGDILSKENGKRWAGYVQHNGMSYLDAYKLAFHDEIVANAQKAANTAASVRSQSKSHLVATGSRGQGAVEVPARIKDFYRQFQPGMTDAEIEADYNKRMQE